MDILEGNTHASHTTPHCCCDGSDCNGTDGGSCISDKRGNYGNCDKWGYGGGFGGTNPPGVRYD